MEIVTNKEDNVTEDIILSEIKNALLSIRNVFGCKVLSRLDSSNNTLIVAYVVSSQILDIVQIKNDLKDKTRYIGLLGHIEHISSLPYDSNGSLAINILEKIPLLTSSFLSKIKDKINILQNNYDFFTDDVLEDEVQAIKIVSEDDSILIGDKILNDKLPENLSSILENAAKIHPNNGIRIVGNNANDYFMTYKELLFKARKVASGLQSFNLPIETPVILQCIKPEDIFITFWGIILAGSIPVPLSVPLQYTENDQNSRKLIQTIRALESVVIIGDKSNIELSRSFISKGSFNNFYYTIDDLMAYEPTYSIVYADPGSVTIYLQTSGSTSAPKIVPQTHYKLIMRTAATIEFNGFKSDDISLNCFPLDHVCGLIMFHLRDVMLGCNQIHSTIFDFLESPLNWLIWCDKYRVTNTWAPNFAFNLINTYAPQITQYKWDLSSLKFIENCAEQVIASQVLSFIENLQKFCLDPRIVRPSWGMSETCSVTVLSKSFAPDRVDSSARYVKVGKPYPLCSIRIVNEDNVLVKKGETGKLQIKGACVFNGYLNNPKENEKSFIDGWFETGDLGQVIDDELAIVGRTKDVIIINGINIAAHEVERCVELIEGVLPSFSVAVMVNDKQDASDKLAVFFVLKNEKTILEKVITNICTTIAENIGLVPNYLIVVDPNDIPKTSVGKIQRSKLKLRFENGEFKPNYSNTVQTITSPLETDTYAIKILEQREINNIKNLKKKLLIIFSRKNIVASDQLSKFKKYFDNVLLVTDTADVSETINSQYQVDFLSKNNILEFFKKIINEYGSISCIAYILEDNFEKYLYRSDGIIINQALVIIDIYSSLRMEIHNALEFFILKLSVPNSKIVNNSNILSNICGIASLARTINIEQNSIRCKYLKLFDDCFLEEIIFSEMNDVSKEPEIIYQDGKRYVPRLKLDKFPNTLNKIESNGLYVLIGGLGGIGPHLAEALMNSYSAAIVLSGRTGEEELSKSQKEKLLWLKKNYPNISYVKIDITDSGSLAEALLNIQRIADRKRKITGIFNLAAYMDQNPIIHLTRSILDKALEPKVQGTWNLYESAEKFGIPLIVNFSSVNGYFGGSNVPAYSMANCIQEEISDYVNQKSESVRMVNISWSMWNDVGLSKGFLYKELTVFNGYEVLSIDRALLILFKIIRSKCNNLLVGIDSKNQFMQVHFSQITFPKRMLVIKGKQKIKKDFVDDFGNFVRFRFLENEIIRDFKTESNRIQNPSAVETEMQVPTISDISEILFGIWTEIGIENIQINKNIFEMGTRSIFIPQIIGKIKNLLDVDINVVDLFQYSSIGTLAQYISKKKTNFFAEEVEID